VLVVNHASYLDSLVLAAALPNDYRYVAKRELLDRAVTRLPLSRVGTLFVERSDAQRSASEGQAIAAEVAAGHSLVYFPEGTFGYVPGLLPFRMGAFMAAAQAGVPVVPVAVNGSRTILPAGSWRPRRSRLRVVVLPAIAPTGSDWAAVVRLRDAARAAILAECGEPDRG
jgi:1-acyl-sn-glycerol-3-phosphate acyltransferase